MTCAFLRPRAGNRSIGISHCLGGLAGKSNAKPSCSRFTVNTPLRVWKRTGHVVWFRSVSTWADANVACPQRSISTSGVNQRKSKLRSEEHTSELQSRLHLVCRLLLEKKKKNNNTKTN